MNRRLRKGKTIGTCLGAFAHGNFQNHFHVSVTFHGCSLVTMESNDSQLELDPLFDLVPSSDDDTDTSTHSDDEDAAAPKQEDETTRASVRRAILADWIARSIDDLEKKDKEEKTKKREEKGDLADSINELIARGEGAEIKDPREYQITLFEKAKTANTIAVLPTGSGKTMISVLLLRHVLDQEIEDRSTGKPPRYAFFLVNNTTLVFQQANVLNCNLDHKILRVCGADGADNWSKSTWEKHFKDTMVIVCTAEILVQCLLHGFIRMDQINLLIFDEAHHAKGNHPYARLMNEHYKTHQDISKRPLVFGMTASPVDAKVDLNYAASELERTLDSRITTIPLSGAFRNNSKEVLFYYDALVQPFETDLHRELQTRFGKISTFESLFRISKGLTSSIGSWGSDFFWSSALAEDQAKKVETKVEKEQGDTRRDVEKLNRDIAVLKEASELIKSHDFGMPTLGSHATESNISSKVLTLHDVLYEYFSRPTQARCIVFVEQRWVARLLSEIFNTKELGGQYLKSAALIGSGNGNDGASAPTFRKQVLTLLSFRKGDLNCLFATSIAEEGLDIPECNLVVRFDLYKTMIGYIQSKGRARHQNSKFVDMLERDKKQEYLISDIRQQAASMTNWCSDMSRHQVIYNADEVEDLDDDDTKVMIDAETGARCTFGSALGYINHFCATLPTGSANGILKPLYDVSPHLGGFKCELIMPSNSPVERCSGSQYRSKARAKQSAAFEMCRILHSKQYLDGNFVPIYADTLPEMRNARLAISSKKGIRYDMRQKPTLWTTIDMKSMPIRLYLTTINVEGKLDRPHQPMGILTRTPLPEFPKFPLFMMDGSTPLVFFQSVSQPIDVDEELLNKFTRLYHVILLDIYNKTYEEDTLKMPYWVVPLQPAPDIPEDPFFRIDMEAVDTVCEIEEYNWTPGNDEIMNDKFVIDPYNGGVRYFTIAVDPTKKPQDPIPEGASVLRKSAKTILENCISMWTKSREGRREFWDDPNQPVIKSTRMQFRRNLLDKPEEKEVKAVANGESSKLSWICPRSLKISTLSPKFVTMLLTFPGIIHRLEDYLIALEGCRVIDLDVNAALALEAMTQDSDNSGDHHDEKINFRAGMGANYERLEFIGDTFLKMATSISLFVQNPNNDEFQSHVDRMVMLCNANLFRRAKDIHLYEYIRTQAFSRRFWYPPNLELLAGKGVGVKHDPPTHGLHDKAIADVSEALIGAAFVQHTDPSGVWEPEKWDAAVKTVTLLVDNPNHGMTRWADYADAYILPDYQIAESTAVQRDLERKVGMVNPYKFKYPRLLSSAFQHSYASKIDHIPSYQRLEFLGDSLYDVACVSYLFYRFPNKDPQWLTEHKSPMVSNKFLAALCVKLGFHTHMRYFSGTMESNIRLYVLENERHHEEANGAMDYWNNEIHAPKYLGDVVESYIGAIFIDSGFNFSVVQEFFDRHVRPFFEDMFLYDDFAKSHPTQRLHHRLNTEMGCRDWAVMTSPVPSGDFAESDDRQVAVLMLHNRIVAWKLGNGWKYAKIRVTQQANEMFSGMSPIDFRGKYGCTCPLTAVEVETAV